MSEKRAELEWKDSGVPVSTRFDDPYFSLDSGLDETRHVFLSGNDLPARFRGDFHIAELGFGTGLNFLAAWQCWRGASCAGRLHFTSFEAYPMQRAEMARALAPFAELSDQADTLLRWFSPDGGSWDIAHDLRLSVIIGDARAVLPAWPGRADAWFLDGFSPAKNPELWGADLLAEVARHTAPGGTAATYTAAGFVRRGLQDAGFEVTRVPGYGRKRHMTRARLP